MNKLFGTLLNVVFFTIIIVISVAVSTIALTRKVNEYRKNINHGVTGAVVKEVVPVLSLSEGIVKKVNYKAGQEVGKGELLVEIENPVLAARVETLSRFKDNSSAVTEAEVAKEQLGYLNISSPVNGIIGEMNVSEGSPVENLTNVATLYNRDNVRLLAELSVEEYQAVRRLREVTAYSPRLHQSFIVRPDALRPNVSEAELEGQTELKEKKIGLFFTFKNKEETQSLLHNEDLELHLYDEEKISKPIDVFVDFWNSVLLSPDE